MISKKYKMNNKFPTIEEFDNSNKSCRGMTKEFQKKVLKLYEIPPVDPKLKFGFNKHTGKMGYYLEEDLETDPKKIDELNQRG